MRPAHVIEIETPKGVLLNGLWFGPTRAETVIIWVHGLSSSLFSKQEIMEKLARGTTAVLAFNNRGSGTVNGVRNIKGRRMLGGAAHEIFTDCVDDIDGAIRSARKHGAKNIYLAGHSTGCQKSVYWAHKRKSGVKALILLAPMSDHAGAVHHDGAAAVRRALTAARALVAKGEAHTLLPKRLAGSASVCDAQRYISLYAGEGAEEIFMYWDALKKPRVYRSVEVPMLVLLAEHDEYADRPASEIEEWFTEHLYTGEVRVIAGTDHGFKGAESQVVRYIDEFMKERYN